MLIAVPLGPREGERWDEVVRSTGREHFLQRAAWAELKAVAGWVPRRFALHDEGRAIVGACQVLLRRLPLGVSIAYAPRGPLVEPRLLADAVAALAVALRRDRCASLLCDPEVEDDGALDAALGRAGVRHSPVFVQPRRTLLVDLAQEPAALLAAMRKKTRQYIRKAEREAVVTEETEDLDRFHALLRTVAARDRFGIHEPAYFRRLRDAFGDAVHLFMARVEREDVGALLAVRLGDRAWELYGGWSGAFAEHRPFYLLKWRAMLRMRALGVRRYDVWGLAEGGADDPLAGVEHFKRGFGGEQRTWIGALETPVLPWLYPLWRIAGRRRLARAEGGQRN